MPQQIDPATGRPIGTNTGDLQGGLPRPVADNYTLRPFEFFANEGGQRVVRNALSNPAEVPGYQPPPAPGTPTGAPPAPVPGTPPTPVGSVGSITGLPPPSSGVQGFMDAGQRWGGMFGGGGGGQNGFNPFSMFGGGMFGGGLPSPYGFRGGSNASNLAAMRGMSGLPQTGGGDPNPNAQGQPAQGFDPYSFLRMLGPQMGMRAY